MVLLPASYWLPCLFRMYGESVDSLWWKDHLKQRGMTLTLKRSSGTTQQQLINCNNECQESFSFKVRDTVTPPWSHDPMNFKVRSESVSRPHEHGVCSGLILNINISEYTAGMARVEPNPLSWAKRFHPLSNSSNLPYTGSIKPLSYSERFSTIAGNLEAYWV